MADSVREKILKNIVTSLQAINGTGSYLTDIKSRVYRFGASGLDRAAYPVILLGEPSEAVRWLNAQNQLVQSFMTVKITAWVNADPKGATAGSTILSNIVADMIIALLTTPNRGGFAQETQIDAIEGGISEETGNLAYAELTTRINYRFRSTDPTVST